MYKPSSYLVHKYFPTYVPIYETYFLQDWLPRWNSVEVHLQLSNNGHPVDGAMVGAGLLYGNFIIRYLDKTCWLPAAAPTWEHLEASMDRESLHIPHRALSSTCFSCPLAHLFQPCMVLNVLFILQKNSAMFLQFKKNITCCSSSQDWENCCVSFIFGMNQSLVFNLNFF
jgi:hypothetical protein